MRRRGARARFGCVRRLLSDLPRLDVALALGLCAIRLTTLVTGLQPGSGAVSYVATFALTLPLAWRSRQPLLVAVVASAASVAEVAIGGYHDSVVGLAVWIIVTYSLGAHEQDARRLVAGVAVTAAGGLWVSVESGPVTFWNTVAVIGVLVAPLLAGLWVRQLRLRARELEQLAAQLERERDEQARVAVAEERARIARELHDEVAHAMSVIAVQADAAEGALDRDPGLVRSPLLVIRGTAREALADMRRVLGALRGDELAELAPEPGLARIGGLIEQARATGVEVEVRTEGEPRPLPPALDAAAYRVVQEGLTNVRKHAAARHVEIVIRYGRDAIGVAVADDGVGSGGGGGTGRGLVGVRERVSLLGGEFVAGPRQRGFALSVTLPIT
jgi:signal transduction histidine kinase